MHNFIGFLIFAVLPALCFGLVLGFIGGPAIGVIVGVGFLGFGVSMCCGKSKGDLR